VRILRDGADELYTTAANRAPVVLTPPPPKESKVKCPLCKQSYKNEKGLKIHLSACKKKTQTPATATVATTKSTKKKAGKITTATTNKATKTTKTAKKNTATTAKWQLHEQNLGSKTK
jgi:hypothetical protein